MSLHAAITAKLVREGHITPSGTGRRAQPRRCRDCRAPVLVGDDHDTTRLTATVDPEPLTPLGEALAILEGRRTLALVMEAGRLVMWARDAGHIRSAPAGTRAREDVLREHRCGSPPPDTAPTRHHFAALQLPPNSPPPF